MNAQSSYGARAYTKEREARSSFLDLSNKDMSKYSLSRAVLAAAGGSIANAGFENEVSRAVAERTNMIPEQHGFFIPADALFTQKLHVRDMTAAGASGSNYLVDKENLSFIDVIRSRSVVLRMGAELAAGLSGNVTVPRITADATAVWLTDEGMSTTESQPTVGQITMSPKHVAAYAEISRLLNVQSASADAVIFTSLAKSISVAIDRAALRGAGTSGEPLGITGTAGVGAFTGASLGWSALVNAQEDVIGGREIDVAKCGWVFPSAVSTLLMGRETITGSGRLCWEGPHGAGSIAGCQAFASNSMAAATGIFGAWDNLLIGEWGQLQIVVNPYANFRAGVLGMRGIYAVDVAVRDASAFSITSSIT